MTSADARSVDLYDRYHRHVAAYCRRRTSADKVDDAVADTFLTAWRRIDSVPSGDVALPWLYGVAYKVLGHQWRSTSRLRKLEEKLGSLGVSAVTVPEEVVIVRHESRQAQRALRQLNSADREILLLSAWEELQHRDIATVLDISVEVVRQRFHQAKKRLTREYNRLEKKSVNAPAAQKGGVW